MRDKNNIYWSNLKDYAKMIILTNHIQTIAF